MPGLSGKMNDLERAICARVKTIREEIRWSQSHFAEQLGISKDQLASIEYGRTPLRYDVAWRLRQAFGISLRWLEEGFGFADRFQHDDLPIPSATGLPERALLSKVVRHFSAAKSESLHAVGTEPEESHNRQPSTAAEVAQAINRMIGGMETEKGKGDLTHRLIHEEFLKSMVEDWIERVPLGQVQAFSNKMLQAAQQFIESFPKQAAEVSDELGDRLMWARIRKANATKLLAAKESSEKGLREFTEFSKSIGVQSELAALIERIRILTEPLGMKSKLAEYLGVPQSRVSEWLSGKTEPGGETTLRMLSWMSAFGAQRNNPGRAITQPGRKTQARKPLSHEKQTQVRKKE